MFSKNDVYNAIERAGLKVDKNIDDDIYEKIMNLKDKVDIADMTPEDAQATKVLAIAIANFKTGYHEGLMDSLKVFGVVAIPITTIGLGIIAYNQYLKHKDSSEQED